jgi:hypothetical protein
MSTFPVDMATERHGDFDSEPKGEYDAKVSSLQQSSEENVSTIDADLDRRIVRKCDLHVLPPVRSQRMRRFARHGLITRFDELGLRLVHGDILGPRQHR